MQDRCTLCTECTICSEINLDAPDELLDDVCHMESHFGLFGDSVRFGVRLVHGFRLMHHRLRKPLWKHPMVLLGEEAQGKACYDLFGDSANLHVR
jgi:hypothetical protein